MKLESGKVPGTRPKETPQTPRSPKKNTQEHLGNPTKLREGQAPGNPRGPEICSLNHLPRPPFPGFSKKQNRPQLPPPPPPPLFLGITPRKKRRRITGSPRTKHFFWAATPPIKKTTTTPPPTTPPPPALFGFSNKKHSISPPLPDRPPRDVFLFGGSGGSGEAFRSVEVLRSGAAQWLPGPGLRKPGARLRSSARRVRAEGASGGEGAGPAVRCWWWGWGRNPSANWGDISS